MNQSRRRRPGLERLETRNLLSAMTETPMAAEPPSPTAVPVDLASSTTVEPTSVHLDMATTSSAPIDPTIRYGTVAPSAVDPGTVHLDAASSTPVDPTAVPLAATTGGPVVTTSAVTRGRTHPLALTGEVSGTWSAQPSHPDTGMSQTLNGSGRVRPLGHTTMQGTLHLTGFIANGHASGTLTLSRRRASVTLDLVGPAQSGFSGPPTTWTYTIVQGTGRFARASGHGTLQLSETDGSFQLSLQNGS